MRPSRASSLLASALVLGACAAPVAQPDAHARGADATARDALDDTLSPPAADADDVPVAPEPDDADDVAFDAWTDAPASDAMAPPSGHVAVWRTTMDGAERLQHQPDLALGASGAAPPLVITVDPTHAYQSIEGFGAAMTDTAAWLIQQQLPAAARDALMTRLFDPARGIGLSFVRVPMGACDFDHTAPTSHVGVNTMADGVLYSYADTQGPSSDPLRDFDAGHDVPYIVPALSTARRLNPGLRIVATPWSPPRWMKSNDNWANPTHNSTLINTAANHATWAGYFVRFVQAYERYGVHVDYVTPQNEPGQNTGGYPGTELSAADEAQLVAGSLAPAIARAGLHTRVLGWDWNYSTAGPDAILGNAAARAALSGIAFHCYNPAANAVDALEHVHDTYPGQDVYMTECETLRLDATHPSGYEPWGRAADLVIDTTRRWARAVLLWSLAVRVSDQGPFTGSGCWHSLPDGGGQVKCNSVVQVDTAHGTVTYDDDFYQLGHASMFVRPGAVRVDSNTFGDASVADVVFRNADGSLVMLAHNHATTPATVRVATTDGRAFDYTLPAGAIVTFVW